MKKRKRKKKKRRRMKLKNGVNFKTKNLKVTLQESGWDSRISEWPNRLVVHQQVDG